MCTKGGCRTSRCRCVISVQVCLYPSVGFGKQVELGESWEKEGTGGLGLCCQTPLVVVVAVVVCVCP